MNSWRVDYSPWREGIVCSGEMSLREKWRTSPDTRWTKQNMPQIRRILQRAKKENSFICLRMANMPPPGFWVVVSLVSTFLGKQKYQKRGNSLVILDVLETRQYSWGTAGCSGWNRKSNLEEKESPILILSKCNIKRLEITCISRA